MRTALLAIFGLVVAAGPTSAAGLLEKDFWLSGANYEGQLPDCSDAAVHGKIMSRFARKEAEFWHSDLTITQIDRVREIAYRPWGKSYIPRRFCTARVYTSDGRQRAVSYAIIEDQGIIGATWGIEWCVSGTDRNLAYAPECKMARP
jgi:hypothetical protein